MYQRSTGIKSIYQDIRTNIGLNEELLEDLLLKLHCQYLDGSLGVPSIHLNRVLPGIRRFVPFYNNDHDDDNTADSALSDLYHRLPQCIWGASVYEPALDPFRLPSTMTLPILDLALALRLKACGCSNCHAKLYFRVWTVNDEAAKSNLGSAMEAARFSLQRRIKFEPNTTPSFSQCPAHNTFGRADTAEAKALGASMLAQTLQCLPEEGAKYLMDNLFFRRSTTPVSAFPLMCEFFELRMNVDYSHKLKVNEFLCVGMHFIIAPSKKRARGD
jgi:hypothetical protein